MYCSTLLLSLSHGSEDNFQIFSVLISRLGTLQSRLILPLPWCDGSHHLPKVLRIKNYKQSLSQESCEIPPCFLRHSYFFSWLCAFAVRTSQHPTWHRWQQLWRSNRAVLHLSRAGVSKLARPGEVHASLLRCAIVSLLYVWLCLLSSAYTSCN